jgi:hypothetical protein
MVRHDGRIYIDSIRKRTDVTIREIVVKIHFKIITIPTTAGMFQHAVWQILTCVSEDLTDPSDPENTGNKLIKISINIQQAGPCHGSSG